MTCHLVGAVAFIALLSVTLPWEKKDENQKISKQVTQKVGLLRRVLLGQLDPLDVPDRVLEFDTTVFFARLTAKVSLTAGTLRGLSSLHRKSEIHLHRDGSKRKYLLHFSTGAINVHVSSNVSLNCLGLTSNGTLELNVRRIGLRISSSFGISSLIPRIEQVNITLFDGFEVGFTNLTSYQTLMDNAVDILSSMYTDFVKQSMEMKIQTRLNEVFQNQTWLEALNEVCDPSGFRTFNEKFSKVFTSIKNWLVKHFKKFKNWILSSRKKLN